METRYPTSRNRDSHTAHLPVQPPPRALGRRPLAAPVGSVALNTGCRHLAKVQPASLPAPPRRSSSELAVVRFQQSTGNGVQLMSIKRPPTRGQPCGPWSHSPALAHRLALRGARGTARSVWRDGDGTSGGVRNARPWGVRTVLWMNRKPLGVSCRERPRETGLAPRLIVSMAKAEPCGAISMCPRPQALVTQN